MADFPESLVDANARALCADDFAYATERGFAGARQWDDLTEEDRGAYRKNARPGTCAVLRALADYLDNPRGGSNMVSGAWLAMHANVLEAKRRGE